VALFYRGGTIKNENHNPGGVALFYRGVTI
jgi:hypothetical protein